MTSHTSTLLRLTRTETPCNCSVCDAEARAKHHHYVCKDCGTVIHQTCLDKASQTICLNTDATPLHRVSSRRVSFGGGIPRASSTPSTSTGRRCSFSVSTPPVVSPVGSPVSTPRNMTDEMSISKAMGLDDPNLEPAFAAAAAAAARAIAAANSAAAAAASVASLYAEMEKPGKTREPGLRTSRSDGSHKHHTSPSPSYKHSGHHSHSRNGSGNNGNNSEGSIQSPGLPSADASPSESMIATVSAVKEEHVTFIQGILRQKFLLKFYTHMRAKSDKIGSILEELVGTEQNYVNHMKNVLKFFIEPLSHKFATSDRCNIPSFMPNALATLVPILSFTVDLLAAFQQEQSVENIANTFMGEPIASMVSIYTPFLENHFKLSNCLLTRRKIPDLDSFVKQQMQAAKKAGITNFDLQELLITPVQRISRYKMLLADLLKETSKFAPYYDKLQAALDRISSIANDINKAQSSDSSALIEISVDYTLDPFVRVYSLLRVGNEIWCGCDDGTLQLYNSQTREHVCVIALDTTATATTTVNTTGTVPVSVKLSKHNRMHRAHSTVSSESSQHETHEKRVWSMCLCNTTGTVFCGIELANVVAVDSKARSVMGMLQIFSSSKSVVQSLTVVSPGVAWCASGREGTLVVCSVADGSLKTIAQVPLGTELAPNCLCYVPEAEQVWVGSYASLGICCSKTNKLLLTVPVFGHKRIAGMTVHEGKVWCIIGGRVLVWQPSTPAQRPPATTSSNTAQQDLLRPQLLQRLDVCSQLLTGLHLFSYPDIMQILITTRRDNGLFLFDAQSYEVVGNSSVKTALSQPIPITFGPNVVSTVVADTLTPSLPNINPHPEEPTNPISLAASCLATAASILLPSHTPAAPPATTTSPPATAESSSSYIPPKRGTLDVWANSVEGPRLLVVFRVKMLL
ncbi:RhoGEF domain [Pelomyxa schiedti]|nr:RhoGEF domain [Pelomyxa schiedti]